MDLHVCCNPSGFLCLLNHLYGIPNPLNYVHAPSSSVPSAVHFPSPWYIAMQDAGKTPLPERPPHNRYPLPCAGNASSAGSPESSHSRSHISYDALSHAHIQSPNSARRSVSHGAGCRRKSSYSVSCVHRRTHPPRR